MDQTITLHFGLTRLWDALDGIYVGLRFYGEGHSANDRETLNS